MSQAVSYRLSESGLIRLSPGLSGLSPDWQVAHKTGPDRTRPFRAGPESGFERCPDLAMDGSFPWGGPLRGASSAEFGSLQKIQNGIENGR